MDELDLADIAAFLRRANAERDRLARQGGAQGVN